MNVCAAAQTTATMIEIDHLVDSIHIIAIAITIVQVVVLVVTTATAATTVDVVDVVLFELG